MPKSPLYASISIGHFNHFFIGPLKGILCVADKPAPPSRATSHLILYLAEGQMQMYVGGERYTIQEEEMLVVAAGQVVWPGEYTPDKRTKGFLLQFDEQWLTAAAPGCQMSVDRFEFLDPYHHPRIRIGRREAPFVEGLFRRIIFHHSDNLTDPHGFIPSLLMTLFAHAEIFYRPPFYRAPETVRQLTNGFLRLLHEHHTSKQRVSDYAELLGVTPNHLNKVVKEASNKSPTRWIDEAILLDVKVLLAQTEQPVSEIAAVVGIPDASYFSRLFRKYEGMTPGEYRGQMKAGAGGFGEGERND